MYFSISRSLAIPSFNRKNARERTQTVQIFFLTYSLCANHVSNCFVERVNLRKTKRECLGIHASLILPYVLRLQITYNLADVVENGLDEGNNLAQLKLRNTFH